jgi:DNA-binding CsgD family transcriptional regulator
MLGRRRSRGGPLEGLTEREREVLAQLAEGKSNLGIAEALVVTTAAVEKHITSIFQKLKIWSMNPDCSGQTRLTTGHTDTTPEFSPDGTKIVFVRLINNTRQLFTMNADGSGQTQIPTSGNAFFPAWSQ